MRSGTYRNYIIPYMAFASVDLKEAIRLVMRGARLPGHGSRRW
jgi:hypothetical protein